MDGLIWRTGPSDGDNRLSGILQTRSKPNLKCSQKAMARIQSMNAEEQTFFSQSLVGKIGQLSIWMGYKAAC